MPGLKTPTVGDTELVIDKPDERVTHISVWPSNPNQDPNTRPLVYLEKDGNGKWTSIIPGMTVEEKDGKLVVKLQNPLESGYIQVYVTDGYNRAFGEKVKVQPKSAQQTKQQKGKTLPRTGEQTQAALGFGLLGLAGLALIGLRRKNEHEGR